MVGEGQWDHFYSCEARAPIAAWGLYVEFSASQVSVMMNAILRKWPRGKVTMAADMTLVKTDWNRLGGFLTMGNCTV